MNQQSLVTNSNNKDLEIFNPKNSALRIHSLDTAEKIALRIKDYSALGKAVDDKLEEQALFAADFDSRFKAGGDRKTEKFQNDSTVNLKPTDYCSQFGFHYRTVRRWCEKLLDPEKKEIEREIRKTKVRQLISMEQAANYSSESDQWYTPSEYIGSVTEVLGEIDLDPASCKEANKTIKAKKYLDKGSLETDWYGCVFLNPPYGKLNGDSLASLFCEKAIAEHELGNTKQTIILVNSVHSQNWQSCLYDYVVCFVDHRIQFISGDGEENKNPTFQNIFIYLGNNKDRFADVFSKHGYVMEKIS